jgi:hypothetical protein
MTASAPGSLTRAAAFSSRHVGEVFVGERRDCAKPFIRMHSKPASKNARRTWGNVVYVIASLRNEGERPSKRR